MRRFKTDCLHGVTMCMGVMIVRGNGRRCMGVCTELPFVHGL